MQYTLHHGDCLDILPTIPDKSIDAIITDPPYPDYHVDLYGFVDISFLSGYNCRQFVFWSSKADFPIDHTAIHIWDKKVGAGSQYERIFERNGGKAYRVFRHYLINSTVAASFTKDEFTGHKSQKPIQLMRELVEKFTKPNDVVFDPFMGSGSTGVACVELGRRFIGIEKNQEYFNIAQRRIEKARKLQEQQIMVL
jgi:site-specific DNA-methyltransferase (adenine-specific)